MFTFGTAGTDVDFVLVDGTGLSDLVSGTAGTQVQISSIANLLVFNNTIA